MNLILFEIHCINIGMSFKISTKDYPLLIGLNLDIWFQFVIVVFHIYQSF